MKTFVDELRWHMSGSYRFFDSVNAGNYVLSIQASEGHYCSPRKNLPAHAYFSFELAIWHKDSQHFLNAAQSSVMRSFPRWEELKGNSGSRVFGWVPEDLINDLINYLNEKAKC